MVRLTITDIGKNLYTVVRGKLECGFKYHDHYDELDSSNTTLTNVAVTIKSFSGDGLFSIRDNFDNDKFLIDKLFDMISKPFVINIHHYLGNDEEKVFAYLTDINNNYYIYNITDNQIFDHPFSRIDWPYISMIDSKLMVFCAYRPYSQDQFGRLEFRDAVFINGEKISLKDNKYGITRDSLIKPAMFNPLIQFLDDKLYYLNTIDAKDANWPVWNIIYKHEKDITISD